MGAGPRVAIIGGGMSGLAMGIALRRAGMEDFTIHEKAAIITALQEAGLLIEQLQEPPVTERLIARREAWKDRLGCPALLLLALTRAADSRHDH